MDSARKQEIEWVQDTPNTETSKSIKLGWKVLDTHVGSASSLIAYHEAGIRYVGFEIDEKMYHKAMKRLEAAKSQMSIFDLGVSRI